ncbi:hypothetical protein GCM10010378_30430 [Streptomyces viridochromogenes]
MLDRITYREVLRGGTPACADPAWASVPSMHCGPGHSRSCGARRIYSIYHPCVEQAIGSLPLMRAR